MANVSDPTKMELVEPGPPSQDNGAHRSKVCAVCGGESQTYHLNFGVGSCNSCRAFFRRSVQVGHSAWLKLGNLWNEKKCDVKNPS